jgi:hypothetical protein
MLTMQPPDEFRPVPRSRDIMTSDGGRLTPDVARVSLPKPVPPAVATSSVHSEVNHVEV